MERRIIPSSYKILRVISLGTEKSRALFFSKKNYTAPFNAQSFGKNLD
jgi:hypothetical protein